MTSWNGFFLDSIKVGLGLTFLIPHLIVFAGIDTGQAHLKGIPVRFFVERSKIIAPGHSYKLESHEEHSSRTDRSVGQIDIDAGKTNFLPNTDQLFEGAVNVDHLSIRWRQVPSHDNKKFEGKVLFNGYDLCRYSLVSNNLDSGLSLLLGKVPDLSSGFANEWNGFSEDQFSFDPEGHLREFVKSDSGDFLKNKSFINNCIFDLENELVPAKEYFISSGAGTFRVWVGRERVLASENINFNGSMEVYEKNIIDGIKKLYDIPTDNSGYLSNSRFETRTYQSGRAFEPSGNFFYLDADPFFRETSAFVHANLALRYFYSLGFSDYVPNPILINLNVLINGSANNALYQPPDSTDTGFPTISIANGDGVQLANLATDIDVITHELAHHVIYKYLKSSSGESAILHEGLADFFAFSQTHDSCLGESICPLNSSKCWVDAQCLRTADNDIHYLSREYENLAVHQKGQIVSGLLWDLYRVKQVPLTDISKKVMKALSFLNVTSDIQDFISAYALADQFISAGRDLCMLRDVVLARGFESDFAGVDCNVISTWPKVNGNQGSKVTVVHNNGNPSVSSSVSSQSNSKNSYGFCSFSPESKSSNCFLVILLLPIVVAFIKLVRDDV